MDEVKTRDHDARWPYPGDNGRARYVSATAGG